MKFLVLGILLSYVVILSEATNQLFLEMNKSTNKVSLTGDIQTPFTLSGTTTPDETSSEKMPTLGTVSLKKNLVASPTPDSGSFPNETITENGLLQTKTGLLLSETTTVPTATGVLPIETTTAAQGVLPTKTTTSATGLLLTEIGSLPAKTTTVPTKIGSLTAKITTSTTTTGVLLTTAITVKSLLQTKTTTSATGLLLTEIGSLSAKTTTVPTEIGSLPAKITTVSTDKVLLAAKPVSTPSETDHATSDVPIIRHSSQQTSLQTTPTPGYFLCSDYSPKSCLGFCGQAPEVGCACDELCLVYNSCCDDYQDVCSKEANLASIKFQRLLNLNSTCERVSNQVTTGAQVISSCPLDYSSDPEIKQQCENGNILFIPVTSRNLKLHFRSVYCMLCNGGQLSDGLFWTIAASVYGKINTMFETINEFTKTIRGGIYFVPINHQDVPLRHCFVEAVASSCIENSKDLGDDCFASKENLVSLKNGLSHIIFKNIYCLKCFVQNQSSLDQLYCKHTQMLDLKGIKAPKFHFFLDWKTSSSFLVTSKVRYVWEEKECHLNEPEINSLQPFCQITKCNEYTVLKNNTCVKGNTLNCFLYQFRLHLNLSEHLNDLELVNKTLAIFQFKLADTLYQTYSKNISTSLKENKVNRISINSELDQVIAYIWVKLYGPPPSSYLKGKLNTEYIEFLNTTLTDVRLNFSLCACPAYLRYDKSCHLAFCFDDDIYFCLDGSRGDDHPSSGTYPRDMSHYLICFMFVFKYISF